MFKINYHYDKSIYDLKNAETYAVNVKFAHI